jgi:3-deoxy-D-arabino-heptulosonate 7-phosphate (DAHP) synthase
MHNALDTPGVYTIQRETHTPAQTHHTHAHKDLVLHVASAAALWGEIEALDESFAHLVGTVHGLP